MVIWPLNNNGEVVVQTIVDPLTPIWFVIVSGVMSASRWDINRASVMEKWPGVSYNPSRGCGGVSVNWDGAVNRGYPQFTQNLPNLAKMTNSPPEEDGRCESLTHFTPSSSKKGASCDGNKNGNKLSHCANYWPLIGKLRRTDSSTASFSVDIQPLDLCHLRLNIQLNPHVGSGGGADKYVQVQKIYGTGGGKIYSGVPIPLVNVALISMVSSDRQIIILGKQGASSKHPCPFCNSA